MTAITPKTHRSAKPAHVIGNGGSGGQKRALWLAAANGAFHQHQGMEWPQSKSPTTSRSGQPVTPACADAAIPIDQMSDLAIHGEGFSKAAGDTVPPVDREGCLTRGIREESERMRALIVIQRAFKKRLRENSSGHITKHDRQPTLVRTSVSTFSADPGHTGYFKVLPGDEGEIVHLGDDQICVSTTGNTTAPNHRAVGEQRFELRGPLAGGFPLNLEVGDTGSDEEERTEEVMRVRVGCAVKQQDLGKSLGEEDKIAPERSRDEIEENGVHDDEVDDVLTIHVEPNPSANRVFGPYSLRQHGAATLIQTRLRSLLLAKRHPQPAVEHPAVSQGVILETWQGRGEVQALLEIAGSNARARKVGVRQKRNGWSRR